MLDIFEGNYLVRNLTELDRYRMLGPAVKRHFGWDGDDTCGAFIIPSPIDGASMSIIASSGGGWDHVSVARHRRTPNWTEMDYIKRLFFREDETALQLHVPSNDHVNNHPNCLHLWRPQNVEIPRPPMEFV